MKESIKRTTIWEYGSISNVGANSLIISTEGIEGYHKYDSPVGTRITSTCTLDHARIHHIEISKNLEDDDLNGHKIELWYGHGETKELYDYVFIKYIIITGKLVEFYSVINGSVNYEGGFTLTKGMELHITQYDDSNFSSRLVAD